MANILLVEDEFELAALIKDWFEDEGNTVQVARNGQEAIDMLRLNQTDLVILDIVLPLVNGVEVCRRFRAKNTSTPILMLTGKGAVDDKEAGFDAGADDYLTKPFHFRELSARVKALLRRPPKEESTILKAGNITLNTVEYKVKRGDQDVHLLPQEYKLLEFFMKHPNNIFSAETLLLRVWDAETCHSIDTVRGHIQRLRKKLDSRNQPSIISTVRHLGYQLNQTLC